jgi:hypothetical protein
MRWVGILVNVRAIFSGGELHNEVHQYLDFCITQMNGDFQVTNG